jgi:type I restriction enzyme S subunit
MGNIQDGKLDFSDLKYCSVDDEIEGLMLEPGDLLFNRTNSPELVGKSAVYRADEPASFASYLIRVRFDSRAALPEFINYWLNSAWGRTWAQLAKTDGVSQSNINGSKLALMPVPLPPIDEQAVIVEKASRMLLSADAIQSRIESASSAADRSSQAVLAKAFRGQLSAAGL